ncbi:MAG: hypothetical protein Q9202_002326 [Teloschistes flavicans]
MEDQMVLPQSEQSQRVLRANGTYYGSYLPSILNLIANRAVFPHLESLDFEDDIVLRPSFFDAIRRSTIKHLKIKRADIEKPYTISQSMLLGGVPWPLQSLSLNINPLTEDVDISSLCNSILRACARTLKYLEWSTDLFRPLLRTTPSQVTLQFRCLRHLRLRSLTFSDSSLVGALLSAKLVSLELRSIEFMDPEDAGFFSNMGAIETLQTLVWHPQGLDEPGRAEFLLVNQQISKLSLPGPEAPEFLEAEVLPLLVSSFTNLRSLSLVVEGDGFSANARNKIRAIYQLEQLHLSAMKDPDPYWPIVHLPSPEKPAHLTYPEKRARISSLKRLAFSRDSYRYTQEQDHNEYYANGDGGYTAMWRSAFETIHRRDMLRLALQYHPWADWGARVEWIFMGQLQIEMTHEEYLTPTDRLVTSVRNESTWLLEEMFGCEGLAPV